MGKRRGGLNIGQAASRFRKAFEETPTAEEVSRSMENIEVLPTGLPAVDWGVLGIGGLPFGFGVEIFGKEGCLAGWTKVRVATCYPDTGELASNHMRKIENLYRVFHGLGKINGPDPVEDAVYYGVSVNEFGRMVKNQILDVVYTGVKPCFEVITRSGHKLVATEDHRFMVPGKEYKCLSDLREGSPVMVHNNVPYRNPKKRVRKKWSKNYNVAYHPVAGIHNIKGGRYQYYRLSESRAMVEADRSGLSLEQYLGKLNSGDTEGLVYLKRWQHVHHINGNHQDNRLENMEVKRIWDHNKDHAEEQHNNLRFIATPEPVVSIRYYGERPTYDLKMAAPYHNYVAEKMVVHNSGKTLFGIRMCAQFQKMYPGEEVHWADTEGSHVPQWMERNGMDLSRTRISHSLGSAEKYEHRIQAAISQGIRLNVLDSAASMLPESVQHAESASLRMDQKNEQPQFMTNMLMRLEAGWPEAGLPSFANSGAIFIIINHTNRFQSDAAYYDDSKGAAKIKHFCRMRVNIEALRMVRDEDGKPTFKPPAEEGVVRIQCLKNQLALPMCEAVYHVNLRTGEMWDDVESVIELGKRKGTLEVNGAWYNHGAMRWNGKAALEHTLRHVPEVGRRICQGSLSNVS